MRTRSATAGLAAVAVLAVPMLAGCTGASNSGAAAGLAGEVSGQAASSGAAAPNAGRGADSGAAADGTAPSRPASGAAGNPDTPLVDDRQIIRTASVAVQVTVPQPRSDGADGGVPPDEATRRALADAAAQAATKVRALAPGNGGYVSASDGGGATISIVLRIPAESYTGVMHALDGIGEITSRTEKTSDVTDEMIDVASRVDTMKASIDRIRALLAQADKIGDVISIESELASREADLESLQHRQAALKDQVALSTIAVTISAVLEGTAAQLTVARQGGFLGGLAAGWAALTGFANWLGSVAGALLPFTPLIAAVVLVLVWWGRRRRRTTPSARGAVSPPTGAGDLPEPRAHVHQVDQHAHHGRQPEHGLWAECAVQDAQAQHDGAGHGDAHPGALGLLVGRGERVRPPGDRVDQAEQAQQGPAVGQHQGDGGDGVDDDGEHLTSLRAPAPGS
jgi:hypothetical protein